MQTKTLKQFYYSIKSENDQYDVLVDKNLAKLCNFVFVTFTENI